MANGLSLLGSIPASSHLLASLMPEIKGVGNKISRLVSSGELIRLRRDLYVARPREGDNPICLGLVANMLHTPSLCSMSSALRFYGLIPMTVTGVDSVTTTRACEYRTPLGRFTYASVPPEVFSLGVTQCTAAGQNFVIATPERALCDLVACSPGVSLRSVADAERYLAEDIRFDMDVFVELNPGILEAYSHLGRKGASIYAIIKLLQRERALS